MMKRMLALFLTFAMVLGMCPVHVFATETEESSEVTEVAETTVGETVPADAETEPPVETSVPAAETTVPATVVTEAATEVPEENTVPATEVPAVTETVVEPVTVPVEPQGEILVAETEINEDPCADGHNYENGFCTVCGAIQEPDYESISMESEVPVDLAYGEEVIYQLTVEEDGRYVFAHNYDDDHFHVWVEGAENNWFGTWTHDGMVSELKANTAYKVHVENNMDRDIHTVMYTGKALSPESLNFGGMWFNNVVGEVSYINLMVNSYLEVGEKITWTAEPEGIVTWKSNDDMGYSIRMTPIAAGETVLTATSESGHKVEIPVYVKGTTQVSLGNNEIAVNNGEFAGYTFTVPEEGRYYISRDYEQEWYNMSLFRENSDEGVEQEWINTGVNCGNLAYLYPNTTYVVTVHRDYLEGFQSTLRIAKATGTDTLRAESDMYHAIVGTHVGISLIPDSPDSVLETVNWVSDNTDAAEINAYSRGYDIDVYCKSAGIATLNGTTEDGNTVSVVVHVSESSGEMPCGENVTFTIPAGGIVGYTFTPNTSADYKLREVSDHWQHVQCLNQEGYQFAGFNGDCTLYLEENQTYTFVFRNDMEKDAAFTYRIDNQNDLYETIKVGDRKTVGMNDGDCVYYQFTAPANAHYVLWQDNVNDWTDINVWDSEENYIDGNNVYFFLDAEADSTYRFEIRNSCGEYRDFTFNLGYVSEPGAFWLSEDEVFVQNGRSYYDILLCSEDPTADRYGLTWESGNEDIFQIEYSGYRHCNIYGVAEGTATLYAKIDGNVVASCEVTVTGWDSLSLGAPVDLAMNDGEYVYYQFTAPADGRYVLWSSDEDAWTDITVWDANFENEDHSNVYWFVDAKKDDTFYLEIRASYGDYREFTIGMDYVTEQNDVWLSMDFVEMVQGAYFYSVWMYTDVPTADRMDLRWVSSDENVFRVSWSCYRHADLYAVGAGIAELYLMQGDEVLAQCTVNVTKPEVMEENASYEITVPHYDYRYYSFTASETANYTLWDQNFCYQYIEIYNSNGDRIGSGNNMVQFDAEQGQSYMIRLENFSDDENQQYNYVIKKTVDPTSISLAGEYTSWNVFVGQVSGFGPDYAPINSFQGELEWRIENPEDVVVLEYEGTPDGVCWFRCVNPGDATLVCRDTTYNLETRLTIHVNEAPILELDTTTSVPVRDNGYTGAYFTPKESGRYTFNIEEFNFDYLYVQILFTGEDDSTYVLEHWQVDPNHPQLTVSLDADVEYQICLISDSNTEIQMTVSSAVIESIDVGQTKDLGLNDGDEVWYQFSAPYDGRFVLWSSDEFAWTDIVIYNEDGEEIEWTNVFWFVDAQQGETFTIKLRACFGEYTEFTLGMDEVTDLQEMHLDRDSIELVTGIYGDLNLFTDLPTADRKDLVWTSGDENIVQIDYAGYRHCNFRAVGVGTTTVTATIDNKSVSCDVTVREPEIMQEDFSYVIEVPLEGYRYYKFTATEDGNYTLWDQNFNSEYIVLYGIGGDWIMDGSNTIQFDASEGDSFLIRLENWSGDENTQYNYTIQKTVEPKEITLIGDEACFYTFMGMNVGFGPDYEPVNSLHGEIEWEITSGQGEVLDYLYREGDIQYFDTLAPGSATVVCRDTTYDLECELDIVVQEAPDLKLDEVTQVEVHHMAYSGAYFTAEQSGDHSLQIHTDTSVEVYLYRQDEEGNYRFVDGMTATPDNQHMGMYLDEGVRYQILLMGDDQTVGLTMFYTEPEHIDVGANFDLTLEPTSSVSYIFTAPEDGVYVIWDTVEKEFPVMFQIFYPDGTVANLQERSEIHAAAGERYRVEIVNPYMAEGFAGAMEMNVHVRLEKAVEARDFTLYSGRDEVKNLYYYPGLPLAITARTEPVNAIVSDLTWEITGGEGVVEIADWGYPGATMFQTLGAGEVTITAYSAALNIKRSFHLTVKDYIVLEPGVDNTIELNEQWTYERLMFTTGDPGRYTFTFDTDKPLSIQVIDMMGFEHMDHVSNDTYNSVALDLEGGKTYYIDAQFANDVEDPYGKFGIRIDYVRVDYYYVSNMEELNSALSEAATAEGKVEIITNGSFDVTESITVPENTTLYINSYDVTVASGVTVTNHGDITLNQGTLTVDGKLVNNNVMFINDGSTVVVNGTAVNNNAFHVGIWKQENAEYTAGILNINGVFENNSYLNIFPETSNSGGVVNVNTNGTLKNHVADEEYFGFIELHGTLNVYGMLVNDNLIGIAPECTYNVEGTVSGSGFYQGHCGDAAEWDLTNGVLTIFGEGATYDYNPFADEYAPWYRFKDSITSIVVEEGITAVGFGAFTNLEHVTSVSYPATLEVLGFANSSGCYAIEVYIIAEGNENYYTFDGAIINAKTGELFVVPAAKTGSFTVPEEVIRVGGCAFECCAGITEIILNEGLKEIGVAAFYGCESIKEITIPASVETIEVDVFNECSNLTKVTFTGDAPNFDDAALAGLTATAYYPAGNETWTEDVLQNYGGDITWMEIRSDACGENAYWNFNEETGILTITGEGAMYDYTIPSWDVVSSAPWTGLSYHCVVIEEGITHIGAHAFRSSDVTEVTIPATVTVIGDGAFDICSSLTEIELPEGLASIGNGAFSGCGFTTVTIPATVTSVGDGAFAGSSLTEITFTGNAPAFGNAVFNKVTATAYYPAGNATWTEEVLQNYGGEITWVGTCFGEHTAADAVIENDVSATCTEAGSYDTVIYCAVCGEELSRETTVVPALGHDYVSVVTAATCTEKGYTTYTCSVCGDSYVVDYVDALGHTESKAVREKEIAATCITAGSYDTVIYCAVCGEELSRETTVVPALGHDYVSVVTAATCTEKGYTTHTCQVCGDYYKDTYVVALGHKWDAGKITKAATLFTTGVKTYTCGTCKTTKTETVSKLAPAKPYKITNVVSGVHVYWTAIDGVAKYGLWRSETGANGTYKWLANPTVAHFTDTTAESGKTYYYKVTAMNATGVHSEKSPAIGVTYVSTPDITSRFNKAAGISLGWEKITGATGYAIYRKSYGGTDAWVRVATIEGNTTFTWTDSSVKNNNGTVYKYTIRALAGSDMKTLSGCRNAGRTMARLTSRTLSSATKAGATSVKCSWNTSSAVTGYEIRFMVGSEVYKTFTVTDYKTGTKTFTGLKAGQTYKIQVRSYLKVDGMGFYSAWSTAKNVTL